ncbi:hypothetical protein HSACCH_01281 [Halanaerobium saccharolyticum subsp. saccharolyticum DSM 6643]|uniref:Uncharacterized protein n=1 Tax=Halanaerobium saccharolyticum subsp. saccharolyticum DSM 6643 TaxID=1293054 RepID=M5DZV1_9FIRM|nr:hypothetical protein [Halanaerobium saccharolyticum]CCU79373.1 hypothetical protein HSACCH_01281 [Halanaerobium saccharolyticum subsp. saccharolyticum DSM 6643]
MHKKLLVCGIALFFIFTLSSGVFAQMGLESMILGSDIMMSDWQLDYIRPIEPGELEKGEYRLTPIIGRFDSSGETNYFSGSILDNSSDYDSMFYLMALDTAVSENLILHGKYLYKPYSEYNDDGDENRMSLLDLFLDYEFENENKMFFGFNRSYNKDKEYNSSGILNNEEEDKTNFYYLGFEIRGSFAGDNE